MLAPMRWCWKTKSHECVRIKGKSQAKMKPTVLNRKARVKMNMRAQLEEEMDLHEGDILVVTQVIDKNWYRGVCGTQEGVFPSAYVEMLDDRDEETSASDFEPLRTELKTDVDSPVEIRGNDRIFEDDYFKINMPSVYEESQLSRLVPYGITLYPFYAQFDNELSFHEGEIVTLCRHVDKDWIEGTIDSKKGIFPKNYVNILVDCENYSNSSKHHQEESTDAAELSPNLFAKVLYNFDAQMTGDLTVHKDEVVWIVSIANEDWCEVRNDQGKVGLCPQNHLAPQDMLPFFSIAEVASSSSGELAESNPQFLPTTIFEEKPMSLNQMPSMPETPQQVDVVLRHLPQKSKAGLKRQSSDRSPHRPAPPVPVPGHKPVRRSLRRLPVRISSSPECISEETRNEPSIRSNEEEHRMKNAEQRQNVISELVYTEKEYVRDLKITYETFNLHNPRQLIERGVDVRVLHLAEELLDKLQLAMKGKEEDDQCVGACFIELAEQMKIVYGQYCMNHNNALMLLEKYESTEEIQSIFNKGIETLRYQIACFDMGSILIKPVQRILKYPLILNELIKTKDPLFDEHELIFHTMEKTARSFAKDVEIFLQGMQEMMSHQLNIGTSVISFYQERGLEAEDLHKLLQQIYRRFFDEFMKVIEQRVLGHLNVLIELFEGPAILVQKRHDKLLDYDGCYAKAEKNKENRIALNAHLLEELPALNKMSSEVLVECLAAFVSARKMLSGKITKQYLALMQTPLMKACQEDAVDSFPVKHSLVWNQLGRFDFCAKVGTKKLDGTEHASRNFKSQSISQQAYLQSRYPRDMLYCTMRPRRSLDDLELSVEKGVVVGVIKKQDPLGDSKLWFVDDGSNKGFIPNRYLEPLYRCSRPPPPSYEEVVSSTESSPLSARSRISGASDHEPEDNHYEEIPEIVGIPDVPFYPVLWGSVPVSQEPSLGQSRTDDTSSTAGFYYAMYDFSGGGTNMLTVKSGQVLFVLQKQDLHGNAEWWLVEDRFGKKGFVPGNFLSRYEQ
ncbi:hypothetical protein C0J52_00872 [Blattella germanica]|nr:hypothetical protein C0J52_00872 [Blattella germanica]